MRTSKFGLRAFSVALVAMLGLMAFSAVAAQAENLKDGGKAAKFAIGGNSALIVNETFNGTVGPGKLLVEGRKLEIKCTKGEVLEGKFLNESEALAKVVFEGCKAFVHKTGEPITTCIIKDKVLGLEKIKALGIGIAKKHENNPYVLFKQDGEEPFAIIEFEAGKGCALPLVNKVTGSVVAESSAAAIEPTLTFNEGVQKLFQVGTEGDKLLFGTFEAFVEGKATLKLTGAHAGQSFGVV